MALAQRRWLVALLSGHLVFSGLSVHSDAWALDPLESYLVAARSNNHELKEAKAGIEQRTEETNAAWWRLAPTFTATGTLTRNQYEAAITIPSPTGSIHKVITPQDQRDLFLTLSIPIVDVGSWERIGAARRTEASVSAKLQSAKLATDLATARAYYNVAAAEGMKTSAEKLVGVAQQNLDRAKLRFEKNAANELEVKRAESELEKAKQAVAEATFALQNARRTLKTQTGVEPSAGGVEIIGDLSDSVPNASPEKVASTAPEVRAAKLEAEALRRQASASQAAFYPTLTANATERFTNATGFGQQPYYTLSLTLNWRLDFSTLASAKATRTAATVSEIRAERMARDYADQLQTANDETTLDVARAKAARADETQAILAESIMKQRLDNGTATPVDLATAQRESFAATVRRIEADANLAYARFAVKRRIEAASTTENSP